MNGCRSAKQATPANPPTNLGFPTGPRQFSSRVSSSGNGCVISVVCCRPCVLCQLTSIPLSVSLLNRIVLLAAAHPASRARVACRCLLEICHSSPRLPRQPCLFQSTQLPSYTPQNVISHTLTRRRQGPLGSSLESSPTAQNRAIQKHSHPPFASSSSAPF